MEVNLGGLDRFQRHGQVSKPFFVCDVLTSIKTNGFNLYHERKFSVSTPCVIPLIKKRLSVWWMDIVLQYNIHIYILRKIPQSGVYSKYYGIIT